MATRQVSVTIDEELLDFVDRHSNNRSAAIAAALRLWQDHLWQQQMEAEFARLAALHSPDEAAAAQEASQISQWSQAVTDA
ncbi:ribbon-helix-helix domain-containing protein [Synechococcus elongatus IITB4]|uniref:ribbon-helix-helix domain-containing protein n=1 Tax=Synechococcus elongatus TaxID=32046 RepID=UPI0030CE3E2B